MGFFAKLFGAPEAPPEKARHMKRNEKCWCGSGEKYKRCHLDSDQRHFAKERVVTCRTGS